MANVTKKPEMSGLTPKQEAALAALLCSPSISAAALKCGLAEKTIHRYLADRSFNRAFREARRSAVEHSLAVLQSATSEAVEALRRAMKCGKPTVETMAARAVLELGIRAVELGDVLERIDEIETRLEAKQ